MKYIFPLLCGLTTCSMQTMAPYQHKQDNQREHAANIDVPDLTFDESIIWYMNLDPEKGHNALIDMCCNSEQDSGFEALEQARIVHHDETNLDNADARPKENADNTKRKRSDKHVHTHSKTLKPEPHTNVSAHASPAYPQNTHQELQYASPYNAIASDNYQLTDALLKNGYMKINKYTITSLLKTAISYNSENVVDILLQACQQNTTSLKPHNKINSAIHKAAHMNSPRIMQKLINHTSTPDLQGRANTTPLHYGIHNVPITKQLIYNGADIEAFSNLYATPLFQAVQKNQIHCALMLLNNGADPNVIDKNKGISSPLHEAPSFYLANLLLQYGADRSLKDHNNNTPDVVWPEQVKEGVKKLFTILEEMNNNPHYRFSNHNKVKNLLAYAWTALGQGYIKAAIQLADTPLISSKDQANMLLQAIYIYACRNNNVTQFIHHIHTKNNTKTIIKHMIDLAGKKLKQCQLAPSVLNYILNTYNDAVGTHRDENGDTFLHYIHLAPHLSHFTNHIATTVRPQHNNLANNDGLQPEDMVNPLQI